ncbi:ABC transporter ATP-binding protein [Microbulbifer sp. TYP-18]|uniref:ABC transporter ATP-binding protein n=1 Tax=Microbulbifer sp. TYP-18 TaxID=3230024 RepID=UPI0034C6B0A8
MSEPRSVMRVENLSKHYGDVTVLKSLNFSVAAGQVVGYLGVNGAGKSTTIKILIGSIGDFHGEAQVCGLDLRKDSVAVKRRIGYVPEVALLYDALSPMEYLLFHGRMHSMADQTITQRARALLSVFGLSSRENQPMQSFSKGMKQKVLLAAGTLHDPDVLFLDEPMSGLDANAVLLLKEIILRLAKCGKTIFYSSHMLDVVERLCDRIIILDRGEIVADGSFEHLKSLKKEKSLEAIFGELTSHQSIRGLADDYMGALAL